MFYFGGTPSSAEEPALHSLVLSTGDLYADRGIHLVCIDKPGVGGTEMEPAFKIRRDWPRIVANVADELGIDRYAVFGISNGGPHVMACLAAEEIEYKQRVRAAAMIVGPSDVCASGYFSVSHPSGFFEGLINSLPIQMTGLLIFSVIKVANFLLFDAGLWSRVCKFFAFPKALAAPEAAKLVRTLLDDGGASLGKGAALDCQQGLSPLYARPKDDVKGKELSAETAFRSIDQPVALWYGKNDSSVPLSSADWLANQLPNRTKHYVEAGHELYLSYAPEVLDDLLRKMEAPTRAPAAAAEGGGGVARGR
jgi:pimeloyl-ACP methyl ester carboxylesterase